MVVSVPFRSLFSPSHLVFVFCKICSADCVSYRARGLHLIIPFFVENYVSLFENSRSDRVSFRIYDWLEFLNRFEYSFGWFLLGEYQFMETKSAIDLKYSLGDSILTTKLHLYCLESIFQPKKLWKTPKNIWNTFEKAIPN